MKRAIGTLIIAAAVLGLFPGCDNEEVKVLKTPSHAINVAVGQEFFISTKPNASTGYMLWLKEYDANFVILVEDKLDPEKFNNRTFKFKALQKGKTEIIMESRPYWWDTIPPDKQKEHIHPNKTVFVVNIN